MSDLYLIGLRDGTTQDHLRKVAVLKACQEAGIGLPHELEGYFGAKGIRLDSVSPDGAISVELGTADGVKGWRGDEKQGYDVDLSKLPAGVKTIRVYISY